MTGFQSRWDTWEPVKTLVQRTDRTDRSGIGVRLGASVSNVSSSNKDIPAETGLITPLAQAAAKSKLPPTTLELEDWQAFFTERAAILEHDGGLSRAKADRLAFEACVAAMTWVMTSRLP